VLGWANDFVADTGYVAGTNHLTIADIAFVTTFSSIAACEGHVDLSSYSKLLSWFDRMKTELPKYEKTNGEGAVILGEFYKEKYLKK